MRQIKFRIWDKQTKNWLENSCSLHCFSNWSICPFTGKLIDYVYVGAIDGDHGDKYAASPAPDYYMQDGKIVKDSRYVIQQYTGLKDKNGKEIYDGDIVSGICLNDGPQICVVSFDTFGIFYTKIKFYPCEGWDNVAMLAQEHNEIVGNIFENSELLNQ